jgi:hypothetical protein
LNNFTTDWTEKWKNIKPWAEQHMSTVERLFELKSWHFIVYNTLLVSLSR